MRTLIGVGALLLVLAAAPEAWAAAGVQASPWDRLIAWMLEQQRSFHRDLAEQLRALSASGTAGWALVGVSLAYGVFHAAGPGHGKAVIATYLLTQESHLGRGIRLAVASAFVQGAVAVALVYGLIYLADALPRDTRSAVAWSERLSFVLLAMLGGYLALRALRGMVASLLRLRSTVPAAAGCSSHTHGCGCSHSLAPNHDQLAKAQDWRTGLAVILSIGLRPCSGAVLVLVLAKAMGLPWAGIWAVVAMSAGTAATVAALAVLTVGARRWTSTMLGRRTTAIELAGQLVALLGGGIIAALALSLLAGSFGPAHPLGM